MQQEQMVERAKKTAQSYLMEMVGKGIYFYEDPDDDEKGIALSMPHPYETCIDSRVLISRRIMSVEDDVEWEDWDRVVEGEESLYLEISTCDIWEISRSEEESEENWCVEMFYDGETKEWGVEDVECL